ncbi:hypothetical protein BGX33_008902 [Mortierella sp. NVP41]|nr:hypothetical protein BGX33_008902 [Mortierella sp. NVP41]
MLNGRRSRRAPKSPTYSSCGEWPATSGYQNACIWRSTSSEGGSQEWYRRIAIEEFSGAEVSVAWKPKTLELVTGCEDGSVRVWRILTESDGFSAQLVWSDGYSVIVATNVNVVDAAGLSDTNWRLLKQRDT